MLELAEVEGRAEVVPVLRVQHVGVFDGGDRHAPSGEAPVPQRQQVVDRREVVGSERVVDGAFVLHVEMRRPGVGRAVVANLAERNGARLREEVVQRGDTVHGLRERRGYLRVADVGNVLGAARELEVVQLGVERLANLRGGTREVDDQAVQVRVVDLQAVRAQPAADDLEVLVCEPELLADLLRREPVVVGRRCRVVHVVDQLLKLRLALGGALQEQQHVLEAHVVGDGAAVVLGVARRGRRVSFEPDGSGFVDGFLQHGVHAGGVRGRRAQDEAA